jgi:hypothetical protein
MLRFALRLNSADNFWCNMPSTKCNLNIFFSSRDEMCGN